MPIQTLPSHAAQHRRRSACAAGLLALTSVAVTSTAQAQLMGRLKRAVQEQVAGPEQARQTNRAGPARLEITGERVDVFLVAMAPLVTYAEQVQAERVAKEAHAVREREYNACKDRVIRAANGVAAPMSVATQVRLGELAGRSAELMAAYSTRASAGDLRGATAALDSADVLAAQGMTMQFPAMSTCGLPAPRPVPAPPPPAPTQGEMIAPSPGGMTGQQFGRLREMIAVYLLTGGKEGTFAPAELAVLGERQASLARLAPLFQSGALEWAQWGSLGRNWHAK